MTVKQLAELVQGNIVGDGDLVIHAARTLKDARAGEITFVENAKYVPQLKNSQASAAIVPNNILPEGKVLIQVADPLMAFVAVFQRLEGIVASQPSGIDPRAVVHASATVGAEPSIFPFASVGENTVIGKRCRLHNGVTIGKNCRLGDDVVLHPHVVLYDNTVLGDRVIIHANAVIGADGFGYRFNNGRHVKVPQLSNVIIGADVEIGACSTIDRGAFEPTQIGEGTKIDNLVQVAHNCIIGKHNLLASMVGIGGSSSTGNYVILAGQAGVADHLHVGDGVIAAAQSGIICDIAAGERVMGFPARPVREKRRVYAVEEKLPQMRRDLLRISKLLGLSKSANENDAESDRDAA